MTYKEAYDQLHYLRQYLKVVENIVGNSDSVFYNDSMIKQTAKKTINEISRLEELIYLQELEDDIKPSYKGVF